MLRRRKVMKQQFTTHIESNLMSKIKDIAYEERRTLNNTIEYLLAKAIELYKKENGKLD